MVVCAYMKNSQLWTTCLILVAIVIVASAFYFVERHNSLTVSPDERNAINEAKGDVGAITTEGTTSTYVSSKYKFSFQYPSTWRIGDNRIGYGTLQLFNYDEAEADGNLHDWGKGHNKIELVIGTRDPKSYATEVGNGENGTYEETVIGGQKAFIGRNDRMQAYLIELPDQNGVYMIINVYGDPASHSIITEVISTLEWL